MASVAIMAGGAILNAAAFIGGNYLVKVFGGPDKALAEEKRHDLPLEKYESDYKKYSLERTKLQDWIETNRERHDIADKSFAETDTAIKLYNRAHAGSDQQLVFKQEPKFSSYYQPSEIQKQCEMLLVGGGAAALAVSAFKFL